MTARQLESKIRALRSSVRRLLAVHGLCWVLGLVLPMVIAAGLVDWLFHIDPTIRLILLIGVVAACGYLVYRRILYPLLVPFADLDIAMRIEERWPGLNDRLASTVEFLQMEATDQRYGSPVMREATVRQALAETEAINFREVIEPRPVIKAAGVAFAALTLAGLFAIAAPLSSRIAIARLILPFGGTQWPQRTHLELDDAHTTLKMARGDAFGLGVRVRSGETVPESVRAVYRFEDGSETSETLRSLPGGQFRGRIEQVDRPFRFSVTGGDDSTSIQDIPVRVVPPPAIKSLAIRLVPPPYTGLAPQTLAQGQSQFRALEGTRIELNGEATKPLSSALIDLGEQTKEPALTFDASRTRFRAAIPIGSSFHFGFRLVDMEGFPNRDEARYDVRSIADEAPRVMIDEPKTDRDVPPEATVPVKVVIDEDYGLHSARLIYQIATGESEPHGEIIKPLWSASDQSPAPAAASLERHRELAYAMELAPMKLAPGSIVTLHADARDFDVIKGPNVGKSREIRLRIVSKEDAARQFDDARRELRDELARVLSMQKQAMAPVENAGRTLSQNDRLPQAQREDLNNASTIQRQVGGRFTARDEGISARLRRMLQDMKNFRMDNPDTRKQMEDMLARVDKVRDRNLEPAEQGIVRAVKGLDDQSPGAGEPREPSGESQDAPKATQDRASEQPQPGEKSKQPAETTKTGRPDLKGSQPKEQGGPQSTRPNAPSPAPSKPSPADPTRQALADARKNQKAIADELQKMLEDLSEFETYRGVVKDAQELLKQQEQAMKQAADMAARPETMGKKPEDLTNEQRSELSNIAARQSEVKEGFQKLLERMGEMAGRMDQEDPMAAGALREAAEKGQQKGTAGKMGEAAEQLQQNQMGKAQARQEQARNEMRELVDAIQNRRERELARLVKELKNAENELAKTRARQAENLRKMREARRNPDSKERQEQLQRLAREQEQIQKDLERQLQRLAKLGADAAERAGRSASSRMGRAQQDMDNDKGEQAEKEEEEALADLEEAQDEIEQARRDAEEQLANEQLARVGDQIASIAERQQKVADQTKDYDGRRKEGKLSRGQQVGVRGLGDVQSGLKDETGELTETLEGAPVIALTLRRASDKMEEAASRLRDLKTDPETQDAAKAAADRFKQVLDSLKADRGRNGGQQQGGGGGGGGQGGGEGDGIPPTAQLKLLKMLQQEINDRTEALDELRRRRKELAPEQTTELKKLAEDQGTLADLVREMTRPRRDDGEE